MKKYFFVFLFILSIFNSFAQFPFKPADISDPALPQWAQMMYSENPNVFEVDKAFEAYTLNNKEQTRHHAFYKQWKRFIQPYIQKDGTLKFPTLKERKEFKVRTKNISSSVSRISNSWRFVGPEKNYFPRYSSSDTISEMSWHANMYCIDQSFSNPNVLYSGGENGGIYKSINKGQSWQYISLSEDMTTVNAIAVNPSDENDVIANADNESYRSQNGGVSWSAPIASLQSNLVRQFIYNPANTTMVYAGTSNGFLRSLDGGNSWTSIFAGECQSLALNPLNPAIVYALQYNPTTKISDFWKSIDSGVTFIKKPAGWFAVPSADSGLIQSYGGRIAVTEADTGRIYVLLVGESQASAQLQLNGQIGIYKSDDGGESWSRPHAQIGAPYNATTHPNMMTFSGGNDTYSQIYYNTTLVVSQLNPNKILIGGMSMWTSTDAATTFQPVGGYIGNVRLIHPDNQEFKIYKTSPTTEEIWFASDGGINYSTDFVQTHESRCNGLFGSAFWGFDQGWNDDILVGGRYHNGNTARRDGYPSGEFQQLGGGEAASGYVNYSNEKKTYFSDINGVILPDTLNGIAKQFNINEDPNESYVDNASSRIMFDWDYWNVVYLGKDNKMYQSKNGGSNFDEFYSFGNVAGDKIFWIEQSRANTNVIYAQQVVNNVSVIWKTTDRGLTWALISLPQNEREICFSLSAGNADELWISYPQGANANKVFHTTNGGANWINITTPILNDYSIEVIAHQFGTDGGVYLGTYHGPVFYRNNSMSDWQVVGADLPFISYPLRLVPFYRDNKLRLATWHLGIWENELYEPSNLIADFSANYNAFYCPGDTIKFVPHCVASSGATYQWTFPGGNPSTSTSMYPEIVYTTSGNFDVSLTVTDSSLSSSLTKTSFITTVPNGIFPVAENFESGILSDGWRLKGQAGNGSRWIILDTVGGYGASSHCLQYDNWYYDTQGNHDAVFTAKYDFTNMITEKIYFDVAYAFYNTTYSDSLEVLASTDCGLTFTSIYLKGGTGLATAPPNTSNPFVPTSAQWRTDTIDISSLSGYSDVIFSFENIGHYGQEIYLDNINIEGTIINAIQNVVNNFNFNLFPNPVSNEVKVKLEERISTNETMEVRIFDLLGKEVLFTKISSHAAEFSIPIGHLKEGAYFLQLSKDGEKSVERFVKVKK